MPIWMYNDAAVSACVDQWYRVLGVKTYVAYRESEEHVRRVNAGDYDLVSGVLFATVPDAGDLLSTFQMPPENSETKWSDEETTRLLADANASVGPERDALLERAERRVMSELPAVPLHFTRRSILRAAEVQGWYADPLARQLTKRLWLVAPPGDSALSVAPTRP